MESQCFSFFLVFHSERKYFRGIKDDSKILNRTAKPEIALNLRIAEMHPILNQGTKVKDTNSAKPKIPFPYPTYIT